MNWIETQDALELISTRGMKPGLTRMQKLMSRLHHPHRKFKSIHVAGTNGKGSTSVLLESILRAQGYSTGLYLSPHFHSVTERICINGKPISRGNFGRWFHEIRERAGSLEKDLTYFELLTALAFSAFQKSKVDIAIIEVGLGGRLDATNVLENPEISIITNIGLDHTQFLGNSLSKIAWEKAGIVKGGRPCITHAEKSSLKSIQTVCTHRKAPLHVIRQPYPNEYQHYFHTLALKGHYQSKNLALALRTIQVLRSLGWKIQNEAIQKGCSQAFWPGRFDWREIPLRGKKIPILLDGAHNREATTDLIQSLSKTDFFKKKCILIFNTLNDKMTTKMFQTLLSKLNIEKVLIPNLKNSRAHKNREIRSLLKKQQHMTLFSSVKELLHTLKKKIQISPDSWILATGSLYLIGEILEENYG